MVALKQLELHLLGTGGGRFTMITQRRRTAGIRLIYGCSHVHFDPGPGALIFSNWARLSPQKLNGIVITHCHPDHYSDAEVLIEAMSHGARDRRGVLAAPRSVLKGNEDFDASISGYHRNLTETIEILKPGHDFNVGDLTFEATEARHSEKDGVGLILEAPGIGKVGYTSDTGFFKELGDIYHKTRLLLICAMWPRHEQLRYHLNTDEAVDIVKAAEPGCVVLTHFGMKMLNANPEEEASYVEEVTDVPTVAARDGMKIILNERIEVMGPRKSDEPSIIEA